MSGGAIGGGSIISQSLVNSGINLDHVSWFCLFSLFVIAIVWIMYKLLNYRNALHAKGEEK